MIYGINPSSLIDYPKNMSFVIFLGGCNFKCPYCHNRSIVEKTSDIYKEETILKMLEERIKLIKAVTITGGEPTIYGNKLISLIKKIKSLGYKIKLDTNGSNPDILKQLIEEKLLDFIAMDIKNSFDRYSETMGLSINIEKIKESIRIIENSNVDYEFRTTINKEMHSLDDIKKIISYINDRTKLIIQSYKYSKEQLTDKVYTSYSDTDIKELKEQYDIEIRN